ncbi:haloacid dehalogenase type II [Amphritea balenae]|uniref:(S)-2-haloacid dehalogenase n=1 Tax=Amphritea balenae TaxID=452629 RepID=A0A3P1SP39_9GAMM|nr:haloacid dehalogenase type II [Amphritea balenae]RRC98928.1 haloacid dehalogenase type II [Amphritea balenae]GGK62964.1 haloacid dehalogenase [Amphritea balenae]
MPQTIGFDVYGTLVDPVEMGTHLEALIGDQAKEFGQLWHEKKVEYAFRRSLMQQYQDFSVCTLQALRYCMKVFKIDLSEQAQQALMAEFANLAAFNDVVPGLKSLKQQGHTLAAFSNGPEAAVHTLMGNAGVLPLLDDVISVDDIRIYKPSPRVYQYLMETTGSTVDNCWMVSGNPWDVIGAKAAGLKAAWIQRDPAKIFDPWDIEPDLVVNDLIEFSEQLTDF